MKKTFLLIALFVSILSAKAQDRDAYFLKVREQAVIDTVLILNGDSVQFGRNVTPADGQIIKRIDGWWTNVESNLCLDSLTYDVDEYLRAYCGANVIDSVYLPQISFIVHHDTTLVGSGTEPDPLKVDTSIIGTKWYINQQIITSNGYNDEMAQDAVGGIIDDGTYGDVIFEYFDASNLITGIVKDSSHLHPISQITNLQDSLDSKQDIINGAASTVASDNLNSGRALISSDEGKIAVSPIISTFELGNLDNSRSNLQTQIDAIEAGNGIDTIYTEIDSVFNTEYLKYDYGLNTYTVTQLFKYDGLKEGGNVTWIDSLNFAVSPAAYYINGEFYTTSSEFVTLADADPTYSRIDIIVVDTLGQVSVVAGVPAANPQKPTADPQYQIELTQVWIPAGSIIPGGSGGGTIEDEIIYDENIEWTGSSTGVINDFDNTSNAYNGVKSDSVSAISNGDVITFSTATAIDKTNYTNFSFFIYLNESMSNRHSLRIQCFNSGSIASPRVTLPVDKSATGQWQIVSLTIDQLGIFGTDVDSIVFSWGKTGADTEHAGFYIDLIKLQGGIEQPIPTGEPTGNEAAFDGWDKDVSDDFDGNYNSLINKPTITDDQILSLDSSYNAGTKTFHLQIENGNTVSWTDSTGTAGGDNWGVQTVVSDNTLTGDGTSGNPLKADTTIIATKADLPTAGTDDQTIDVFQLAGNILQLSVENDGEATKTVDLSSLSGGSSADTLFTTIALSDETTDLTIGTAIRTFRMPVACTITKLRASLTTATGGTNLVLDINEGGTSILSTKLSIDIGETTSKTAGAPYVISDSSIADDAQMTIDIDQVGSTTAGTGSKVIIYYLKN
ncbi:hypothetical protein [Sunxiuqinia indica]|uniref:hypothetical protein n=1 Tax=Sunxiuqinia indica TaxID=2692584 RepID=UPI00135BABD2|nr:hypothetical protein [Sunxiuqinia indica]